MISKKGHIEKGLHPLLRPLILLTKDYWPNGNSLKSLRETIKGITSLNTYKKMEEQPVVPILLIKN